MNLYLYVFDTLADWEIAHLTAEVHSRRFFAGGASCRLVKVGLSRATVTTMGGMKIVPDILIDEIRFSPDDMLVLPGGDTWMHPEHDRILALAKKRIEEDRPVAAICGATIGLARVGALNDKAHTSNDCGFLKLVAKDYRGEANYRNLPAVNDRNLITASGQCAVNFTYEILKTLKLFRTDTLEAWKGLYLTNEARYFFEMMKSLESRNG
jgi:putative intracellular protease/amidase